MDRLDPKTLIEQDGDLPERKKTMSQTKQEKNKAVVLEAFDTLFNRRDYVAAERYWSPHYIP